MTAVQGNQFITVLNAVGNLLKFATLLQPRYVRLWMGPGRPQLEGKDVYVWYKPTEDVLSSSEGPVQYGNRADMNFEIHLATRSFADQSQIDERRAVIYYTYYWQVVMSFQNRNLFANYSAPVLPNPWSQPVPVAAPSLSVGTMLLTSLPVSEKTQKEEGTIESAWRLKVPMVLALTVP